MSRTKTDQEVGGRRGRTFFKCKGQKTLALVDKPNEEAKEER